MSESTKEQVKERVGEGAQQVQEKASEAKDKTRQKLSQQLDSRTTETGQQMTKTAGALRQSAQQLRTQQQAQPAQLLEGVAERVERFGEYLTANDGDRMLRDVERIARQQPWLVVTGGAVLGLLAARFTKASSTRRFQSNGNGTVRPARPALPAQTGRTHVDA